MKSYAIILRALFLKANENYLLFTMAVPKKKTSKSKRNMRRGSNGTYAVNFPNVVCDATTGEYKLSHHISTDGYYKGEQVVNFEEKTNEEESEA